MNKIMIVDDKNMQESGWLSRIRIDHRGSLVISLHKKLALALGFEENDLTFCCFAEDQGDRIWLMACLERKGKNDENPKV